MASSALHPEHGVGNQEAWVSFGSGALIVDLGKVCSKLYDSVSPISKLRIINWTFLVQFFEISE